MSDATQADNPQDDVRAAMDSFREESNDTGGAREGIADGETDGQERAKADVGEHQQAEDAATEPAEGARARDEHGRFAKQKEEPAPVEAVPPAKTYNAPQSWRPELREKWSTLPPEVQAEVDRRERDMARGLQEAAQYRQAVQQLQQTLTPYEQMLKARGADPFQALGSTLQTLHDIENAPAPVRAAKMAELIRSTGVDIEALDAALAGEAPAQPAFDPAQLEQQITQRVMAQFEKQQQAQVQQEAAREIQQFEQTHEFVSDVAPLMGSLMSQSPGLTMDDAYERACWAHPETRKILQQRQAAESAKASNASTQKARAAASSVKHQPTTAPLSGDEPETLEDAVRAAWKSHAR